ncbi:MAG: hypothetical protein V5804_04235 [Mucilaginibacter sp.]|uniref:hypothetical protein n=1 Tax=Mucilaginibacter sp. TaxID=1882438 RepID=UPI0034E5EC87
MQVVKKASADKKSVYGNAIISDKVKDHGDDPFVVKKAEEAKLFFQKNGLKGLPFSEAL